MASTSRLKGKEKEAFGKDLRDKVHLHSLKREEDGATTLEVALAAVGQVALAYKELGQCQATACNLLPAYAAELRAEGANDTIADLEELFGLVVPKLRAASGYTLFCASMRENQEGGAKGKWGRMDQREKQVRLMF
ncbi:uncharacterized protein JCM10292_001044 [Rhodotorula paludigena]|uniref:uncharacterized protein n=1 Tax=Rhodotorula paludigena TaxID=86838 RepID=UPI00317EF4B2